jgi:hypothetical protein
VTLAGANPPPVGVEGESLFVVLAHDPFEVVARHWLQVTRQRVEQELHVDISFAVERKVEVLRTMAEHQAKEPADVNVARLAHGR